MRNLEGMVAVLGMLVLVGLLLALPTASTDAVYGLNQGAGVGGTTNT